MRPVLRREVGLSPMLSGTALRLRRLAAQLCLATLCLRLRWASPAAPAAHAPLKIGIIGSGHIGGTLARLWVELRA